MFGGKGRKRKRKISKLLYRFHCKVHIMFLVSKIIVFYLLCFSGSHVTLESLMKDKELQATIKGLSLESGRSVPHDEAKPASKPTSVDVEANEEKISLATKSNGKPQKETLAVT